MYQGKFENYFWLESSEYDLHDFMTKVPECLIEKYIAIAAFDGGPLSSNEEEKAEGWYLKNNILYTSKIKNTKILPYEQYDEWYLFNDFTKIELKEPFVNYHLSLRDPHRRLQTMDPSWDKVAIRRQIDIEKKRQKEFWAKIAEIKPEMVLIDGTSFIFICNDLAIFEKVENNFTEQEQSR